MKRRPKPKVTKPTSSSAELGERVAFRVSAELRDRLERHAERIMKRSPGLHVSRSDAARMLLTDALDQAERGVEPALPASPSPA